MTAEHKQEYLAEKEYVDEKHDVERSSVVLDEEENSPIPEVAAIVSNKDDPSLPTLTFRVWTLGVFFTVLLSFLNQFFWFRTNPLTIGILVAQLLAYPCGMLMARVLPLGRLNPGPFNIKEHVLITLCANCAGGTAYAVDIIVIQRVFYKQDFGFGPNFLLILTTQMLGYGMAGILRRYLVYPAAMIWPANLVQVALFNTLHKDEDLAPGQWTRYKFFLVVTFCMFVYHWIPNFLFGALGTFAWICWIKPENHLLAQITGVNGLGVGALTFDWNVLVSFLTSPLIVPWWAQVNIAVGFVFLVWILVPICYYNNVWNAKHFPIYSSKLFTTDGHKYNVSMILTPDKVLDVEKYEAYGPLRLSVFFALTYGIGFAGLASMVTHTWLYHRHKLVAQWRQSREHSEDIHHRLMQAYPEVPDWWYFIVFVTMTIVAVVTCEVWDYKLPWWGVLLAIFMAAFFALPVGLILAVTNQQPGLNIITEYVIGYALPGRPIANVTFKTLGYISMGQALTFVGDLKLGHYMKVPPRAMFWTQCVGTVIAGLINLITANWLLSSQENICTDDNKDLSCPSAQTFYSASVIWGVISPNKMFGPTSIYNPINYFFLIGFVAPIPFYYLKKRFPNTWMDKIHIPVLLAATGMMPPAKPFNYPMWLAVGFIFQYYIRRRYASWHMRFTYVMSAAFDSGSAFSILLCFFIFGLRGVEIKWWGNKIPAQLCPLDTAPTIPIGQL